MSSAIDDTKNLLVQSVVPTDGGTIPPPAPGLTYPPSPHEATHVNGTDVIPPPTTTTPGLVGPLSGNAAQFYNGAGGFTQPYGSGPPLNVKGTVPNHAGLPTSGQAVNDIWVAQDTGHGWVWNGTSWIDIGAIQGPAGATGATGPSGPAGAPGASGAQGAQGNQGPTGPGASVAVGTTTTGQAGTPASVTNSGNSQAAVFNFTVPQGVQGVTGPTGSTGPTGTQGPTGPTGLQGAAGPQGASGPPGPPGGASAYTTLSAAFTMPSAGATAVASVVSGGASQFSLGGIVFLSIGYLSIQALSTTNNTLTLQNLGYAVNSAPGTVAPSGGAVTGCGPEGPQGPSGPTGPQGVQGTQGPTGPAGGAGPQGPVGATGTQGPTGPQGPIGQGYTWRGAWNSATTYAVYDSISYTGSSYVCVAANTNVPPPNTTYWGIMSQQGPAGSQGPTGPQGNPGGTGPTGATGPQGTTGPSGPQGTNAYTNLTASFTVPAVGSTVTITVADATWAVVGEMLWVDQASGGPGKSGIMQIQAKSGNQLTLLNISAGAGIPVADTSQAGLMNKLSGSANDVVTGANTCVSLLYTRGFNAVGNPNFEVGQSDIGGSIAVGTTALRCADRWFWAKTSGAMTATAQRNGASSVGQGVLVPGTSFTISRNFLRITLTTAQATLAAGDLLWLNSNLEGTVFRELQNDVHSISLLVRSSVAGLSFGLALRDPTTTSVSLTKLCTIPSANTWTLIPLPNLPLWSSGGAFASTIGVPAYQLSIALAAGSTWTSPANDAWQTGNFVGALGQSNFASNPVNSTFDVGFVQHEPGSVCTTLIDKPFERNYDECLRYYQKSYNYGTATGSTGGSGSVIMLTAVNANPYFPVRFHKPLATTPTMAGWSPYNGQANTVYDTTLAGNRGISSFQSPGMTGFSGVALNSQNAAVTNYQLHYAADTGW